MKKIIKYHRIDAAGEIWEFESLEIESSASGKNLLRVNEVERINRSIANSM